MRSAGVTLRSIFGLKCYHPLSPFSCFGGGENQEAKEDFTLLILTGAVIGFLILLGGTIWIDKLPNHGPFQFWPCERQRSFAPRKIDQPGNRSDFSFF